MRTDRFTRHVILEITQSREGDSNAKSQHRDPCRREAWSPLIPNFSASRRWRIACSRDVAEAMNDEDDVDRQRDCAWSRDRLLCARARNVEGHAAGAIRTEGAGAAQARHAAEGSARGRARARPRCTWA